MHLHYKSMTICTTDAALCAIFNRDWRKGESTFVGTGVPMLPISMFQKTDLSDWANSYRLPAPRSHEPVSQRYYRTTHRHS